MERNLIDTIKTRHKKTSVVEPEPHHLVGAGSGAGTVTRCGSGSDNSSKHG
jgi:hypothetical protein